MKDAEYKREMAALTATVALGVILGLLTGFFTDGGSSLGSWLKDSVVKPRVGSREDGILWALLGGGAATAIFYIRVFTRKGDAP